MNFFRKNIQQRCRNLMRPTTRTERLCVSLSRQKKYFQSNSEASMPDEVAELVHVSLKLSLAG
jgi:hypothetical protein